jgi:hypothetical protein
MLVRTLQVLVHAEHSTLWSVLMDRLENPAKYAPGVSDVIVVQRTDDIMVRELKLHGEPVREKITIAPYDSMLKHELLEHPHFSGIVVTRIVRSARQSPVAPQMLEYDLELQPRSWHTEGVVRGEDEILNDIQAEMNNLKSRAEELEPRS